MKKESIFSPMLNSIDVRISDKTLTLHELSALDYQAYQQYLSDIEQPIEPDEKDEKGIRAYNLAWQKVNVDAHSRLAAYGLKLSYPEIAISDLHQELLANFNRVSIQLLHDKTAILSGLSLPNNEPDPENEVDEEEASPNE
ncbi:hypothetical protein [Shewanella surugensis]|uniref:Phage portal protein n=1 Tax=Shewanella surugensis TaxID=212020 RepID=A0ABT0L964_9GAMM|nr:hypothetical protein [Shewanella surugensis]MCL1124238.1 hypothetical protein [Shewanella surugensis]